MRPDLDLEFKKELFYEIFRQFRKYPCVIDMKISKTNNACITLHGGSCALISFDNNIITLALVKKGSRYFYRSKNNDQDREHKYVNISEPNAIEQTKRIIHDFMFNFFSERQNAIEKDLEVIAGYVNGIEKRSSNLP